MCGEKITSMDILNKTFSLDLNGSKSLLLCDQFEIKPFGLHQLQDVKNKPAEIQKLVKEEVPWSSDVKEERPESVPIKEEEKELCISQQGEQFYSHGQEDDIGRLLASAKSEEDEEKPQFSQLLHIKIEDYRETKPSTCSLDTQMKREPDEEDCKGPEPGRNPSPDSNPPPHLDKKACGDKHEVNWNKVSSGLESNNIKVDVDWRLLRSVTETTKSSYRCSVCEKSFIYKQCFKKHMMRHSEKNSSLSLVNDIFAEKQNVNPQEESWIAEDWFPCIDCDKKFRYQSQLNIHMMSHSEEKPFLCRNCGKKFKCKSHLIRHMQVHTRAKLFECEKCGKKFREKYDLKVHLNRHSIEKAFVCNDCGKAFLFSDGLANHVRFHKAERPHKCSLCLKRFFKPAELRKHMRNHSEEKPFACNSCDKSFRRQGDLQVHMVSHSGEKQYSCDECGTRFTQRGSMMRHVRTHAGGMPFSCDQCCKRFTTKMLLKEHLKTHIQNQKTKTSNV